MNSPDFVAYLTHDHRHCDELLGALRRAAVGSDWQTADARLSEVRHDVLAHFAAEEEVLFPAFEERTGMSGGPTHVMRLEHEEARLLLEDIAAAVADRDADGVRGHGEALLILLQQHNMKEEHILYPAARESAGSTLGDLAARISARREAA